MRSERNGLESLEKRRLMCIDHLGQNTLMPHEVGQDARADAMLTPTAGPATESAWTQGNKTVLYIRVAYADTPTTAPETLATAQSNFTQVNQYWAATSFNTVSFTPTYTDLVVLPLTQAEYITQGDTKLYADARAAAKAMNPSWDYLSYNLDAVRFNGGPGSYGGQAYVGGRGVWLKTSAWGTSAHEFGHNFGLWHANYWTPTNAAAVIGPGQNQEYGDTYDVMGSSASGQKGHFNPYEKRKLDWILEENVGTVTTSGTYRVYAHDTGGTRQPNIDYGLKINRDGDREYWLDFRQDAGWTAPQVQNGIGVRWDPWGTGNTNTTTTGSNRGSQYLDTTPLTSGGKNDGNVILGSTYSDIVRQIHVTPVAKFAASGSNPASMDVRVNFGSSPSAPVIASLTGSSSNVAVGATVNFAATATDADGDELAYSWSTSDGAFSTNNASTFSRTFSAAGFYSVRLSVSDMKGNVTSQTLVVRVGNPLTGLISGRLLDAANRPVAGAVVRSSTASNAPFAISDSDGYYVLVNLAAGPYTLNAAAARHTLAATFTNPAVVVSGNVTADRNWLATPITYAVTGRVYAYGVPLAGATVRTSGGATAVTNSTGDFTLQSQAGYQAVSAAPGYVSFAKSAYVDYAAATVADFSAYKIGDCNGDGAINNADIAPFVLALTNPSGFVNANPTLPFAVSDINTDGLTNNADIAAFVALLTGGRGAPPSSVASAARVASLPSGFAARSLFEDPKESLLV